MWDFGDNLGGSGANVNHVFVEEGQYTITLTVIDGEGSIGVSKKVISVLHKNEAPVASLDSTYGGLGQNIKVNSIAFLMVEPLVTPMVMFYPFHGILEMGTQGRVFVLTIFMNQ